MVKLEVCVVRKIIYFQRKSCFYLCNMAEVNIFGKIITDIFIRPTTYIIFFITVGH